MDRAAGCGERSSAGVKQSRGARGGCERCGLIAHARSVARRTAGVDGKECMVARERTDPERDGWGRGGLPSKLTER